MDSFAGEAIVFNQIQCDSFFYATNQLEMFTLNDGFAERELIGF